MHAAMETRGDAYVAKLAALLGGFQAEAQLQAVSALFKAHSAESTALVAWLREDDGAWLSRLTGPEAYRPQARLPWPYDTFAALHMQVLGALSRGAEPSRARAWDRTTTPVARSDSRSKRRSTVRPAGGPLDQSTSRRACTYWPPPDAP